MKRQIKIDLVDISLGYLNFRLLYMVAQKIRLLLIIIFNHQISENMKSKFVLLVLLIATNMLVSEALSTDSPIVKQRIKKDSE